MRSEPIREREDLRTYAIVFEIGDDPIRTLEAFARDEELRAAHFTGIGAFEEAVIAHWGWETKEYRDIPVSEQVEVASFAGNVTSDPHGNPKVHAHVVLGRPNGTALAGHLRNARVRPTLEVFLTEAATPLQRQRDEETGLALIRVA